MCSRELNEIIGLLKTTKLYSSHGKNARKHALSLKRILSFVPHLSSQDMLLNYKYQKSLGFHTSLRIFWLLVLPLSWFRHRIPIRNLVNLWSLFCFLLHFFLFRSEVCIQCQLTDGELPRIRHLLNQAVLFHSCISCWPNCGLNFFVFTKVKEKSGEWMQQQKTE